eukprot:6469285-Amphidinium_carterae.1
MPKRGKPKNGRKRPVREVASPPENVTKPSINLLMRTPQSITTSCAEVQGIAGEACVSLFCNASITITRRTTSMRKPVARVHKVDREATVVAKFPRDAVGEVLVLVLDDDKGGFAIVQVSQHSSQQVP